MSFQNYNITDNAYSTLLTWITASATSLQVQAGDWDLFPSGNFIATLVQYETLWDETSDVVKREKVLVSNNASDTFTISKWFDWDTPVSFDAWDFIYLNVVSAIVEDIQDEVERLETDKLDSNWELRTWLTAYRLLLINSSWNETELALWTSGQVLISQWTTSNPTWQAPSVDIAWLTATTTPIWSDLAVIYDWSGNKKTTLTNLTKWLQEASETVKWTVERATDAEAEAWTDTTRYVTPSQILTIIIPSDVSLFKQTNEISWSNWQEYEKIREVNCNKTWTYRIIFNLRVEAAAGSNYAYGIIYKNGEPFWTEKITSSNDFEIFSEDLSFERWDKIQLYCKPSYEDTWYNSLFEVRWSEESQYTIPTL